MMHIVKATFFKSETFCLLILLHPMARNYQVLKEPEAPAHLCPQPPRRQMCPSAPRKVDGLCATPALVSEVVTPIPGQSSPKSTSLIYFD